MDLTVRMMQLVIQIGVILFVARLGNMLFERLRMPGVLGELCAGIVIGPTLLGGIGIAWLPGFEQGLFHVDPGIAVEHLSVSPELYGFCTVASVILLFLVGMETDLKLFIRYSLAGSLVGLGGVAVSFATGDLIGVWLLPWLTGQEGYHFMHPACIFLGVMSTATSVSITARILSERKKLETPEGSTILAGAVLDDVLGIVMLAIGMGMVSVQATQGASDVGIQWGKIAWIAVKSIGIWLGATVFGVLAARTIGKGLKRMGGHNEIAMMALGLAMVVAGAFEEAHLAMIIGAYVMGLSLSRTDISQVVREAMHPIYAFLVPLFFVVMGMMVDVRQFASGKVLVFGAVYTLVAIVAKLVGCGAPTLLCGFNLRGAARVGLGMIPRGEVALIIAGIGLASGCLTQEVFGVAVFMTLITTVLPPPFLVMAFRSPHPGVKNKAEDDDPTPELTYRFPTPQMASLVLRQLMKSLRQEGFFVHTLNASEGLHQARKDKMVIGITKAGEGLVFDAPRHEWVFIETAMREVVAEIEETLKALRHPIDMANIRRADAEAASPGNRASFTPTAVIVGLRGATKETVIEELLDALVATGKLADKATALADVLRREASMSTGLSDGLACPHGRTRAVSELLSVVGTKPEGIDFQSADGEPSTVFTLVLSPENVVVPYMELMARISSVFDADGRRAALACATPAALLAALAKK
ncbi:MAG: cation:proton antiporter [Kiritimatiellaeota bacterium]|nr:cation:proton antiporter [Kiritimatiellota bacterium]